MSGHSKWSTIKRKKGAADAKKGKIFSKLAKELAVAARAGGGDPASNAKLRTVLLACKTANMPKDNIERAIKKGTGELPGVTYEEVRYECYGPGGVAMLVDVLTDNKRRAVAEIRHIITKFNGSMAETGAVRWNFDQRGVVTLPKEGLTEEEIFEKAIEAGAEDVDTDGDCYEVMTAPSELHTVSEALEAMGLHPEEVKLTMVPKTTVSLDEKSLSTLIKLTEALEDNDDVQDVFSNADLTDEAMAAAMEE
ncbi:MAG TPA: YebC/PmpR family DNA-binding transcriptional regulator [Candidatus Hydrogenedentes bacterium]|nr:YebC/PmpR family DNA-binding transcriptional regulator [Candidatus Hydrogenedentota bacterium]